ncbi:L-iditol 2-dehydrogenase [Martiniozyma asiatica (nom. inval.)]|nr:L-iditol 2-dehydrogenase [Martiniozyma asiatica]
MSGSIEMKQDNPCVVLEKVGSIIYENRPVPEIKEQNYVKIAITHTGLCGSDVHYYETGCCGSFKVESPMVLGHESAGVIVEVGKDVTSLKVGDRVACEPGIPSRLSKEYKSGIYNLCPHMAFAATPPYDGTLCRYYLLPEDFCVKLPDNVSLEEGALVEPLSVGVHANRLADVKFGDSMLVFGAGPVGLLAAATAKAFGCSKVLLCDIIEEKLNFALDNDMATHTFNTKGKSLDDLLEKIDEIWEGERPTVGIDATGNKFCISMCLSSLANRGRYVQVGMGGDILDGFPIAPVMERELKLMGSFRYGVGDYATSVELLKQGKVKVKNLVTHRFKFEEAVEAYEFSQQGKSIKIMIEGPQ